MAYKSNIPQAGDLLSQSQTDILNNFTALYNVFDVNAGVLKLPINVSGPTTAASTIGLYSKNNTLASPVPALFWRQQNSGTEIDFTTGSNTTTGWCRLPTGLIMKWASGSVTTGSSTTVGLAAGTGVPDITTVVLGSVTPAYSGSSPEGNVFWKSYDNTSGANAVTVSAWKPFSGTVTLNFYVLVMGV